MTTDSEPTDRAGRTPQGGPDQGVVASTTVTGLEHVRGIAAGVFPRLPLFEMLGLRLDSVEEGEVRLGFTATDLLLNHSGFVHGGVLCTLMDTVMGLAVRTTLGAGRGIATIELQVAFLRPMLHDGHEVSVVGTVLKRGNTVSFAEGRAISADGVLLGHGSASLATVTPAV